MAQGVVKPNQRPYRVLFVCLGNICRSPAAEIIFRRQVSDTGRDDDFEIDSAGTLDYHEGASPDPRMSETLKQRGYTISGQARQIQKADLDYFDLIVTMDQSNYTDVKNLDQTLEFYSKIQPLVGFCSKHDDKHVPDPYYGGQEGFEHVARLLEDGCAGILNHALHIVPMNS
ncbi:MAG: low molecular weight phosphotyrosine protein phosphatase [Akkermansiaceae bacterium]|nr:low molecular weight phosphotyrosine protein phosphatase [Akkermansiaceae bacterium]